MYKRKEGGVWFFVSLSITYTPIIRLYYHSPQNAIGNLWTLKTIEKVYKELSDTSHPVSVAMAKMQEIEEIKLIEGEK